MMHHAVTEIMLFNFKVYLRPGSRNGHRCFFLTSYENKKS